MRTEIFTIGVPLLFTAGIGAMIYFRGQKEKAAANMANWFIENFQITTVNANSATGTLKLRLVNPSTFSLTVQKLKLNIFSADNQFLGDIQKNVSFTVPPNSIQYEDVTVIINNNEILKELYRFVTNQVSGVLVFQGTLNFFSTTLNDTVIKQISDKVDLTDSLGVLSDARQYLKNAFVAFYK